MPTIRAPRAPLPFVCIAAALGLLLSACASREERVQRLRAEAENALFEGKPDAAIATLRKGLDSYPDANELRVALANALADSGQRAEAATLFAAAIEQDAARADLWVRVAELRSRIGETEAAIDAFQSYLAERPKDFLAWKELCLENERAGRLADAIKAATQWNSLSPAAAPALKIGELYHASANLPQARSWYGQAAAYERGDAAREALARLIELETGLKQFEQSELLVAAYQRRFGGAPSDPRVADAARILDDWRRAKEEIARAAAEIEAERRELERQAAERAQAPAEPEPQLAAADEPPAGEAPPPSGESERAPETLFEDGAQPRAQAAAGRDDAAPARDARSQQAARAAEGGDHHRAIRLLWQLLGEDARDAQLWYRLARSYSATEAWFDAEACILEARRRAPDSEAIATLYALIAPRTQSEQRAGQEIEALRQAFPRSAGVSLAYARFLREAGASRSSVARAYRDFLALADSSHPGHAEAARYARGGD